MGLSDEESSKRKKKKKSKKNKKKKKQKKQQHHQSEDEQQNQAINQEHQDHQNQSRIDSGDFSEYEDYKNWRINKKKQPQRFDPNDLLQRKMPEKLKKSQLRQFIKRRTEEGQINLFNHIVVVKQVQAKPKATDEDKFISLFGDDDSDSESDENVDENNQNNLMSEDIEADELDLENLKQYKINLKTPRNVSHRTEITLNDRIENILMKQQQLSAAVEQKVS